MKTSSQNKKKSRGQKNLFSRFERLRDRLLRWWNYFNVGVWRETRSNLKINTVKTISLSVKSFLDTDLQSRACAMAFRTVLALVPAMALLFAIGRGFGFQTLLEDELYALLPAQKGVISDTLKYADSYLQTSSEGIFVGIGLIFLLWTLITLVSNVEDAFNLVWGVKSGRPLWRKITDYTAMLLILPILMICASGLSIFLSSTLQSIFHFSFMTPIIKLGLKFMSWVFTWFFFAAAYLLIPNTKVRFLNALIAGVFAGTGFLILQWLFVSGQLYVTRYNAIYGSFAFFPLLLLWLQLTWVVCLSGAVLCYSSQNIFRYSFSVDINSISPYYRQKVTLAVAAIVVQNFTKGLNPPTAQTIIKDYGIPARLASDILDNLLEAHIINRTIINPKEETIGYTPAIEPSQITVELVLGRLGALGRNDFIPHFDRNFSGVDDIVNSIKSQIRVDAAGTLLSDLKIKN